MNTNEAVEVTRADLDAAQIYADYYSESDAYSVDAHHAIARAFARHRIASAAAARPLIMEEAAGIMDERAKMYRAKAARTDPFAESSLNLYDLRIGHAEASEHGASAIRTAAKTDGAAHDR